MSTLSAERGKEMMQEQLQVMIWVQFDRKKPPPGGGSCLSGFQMKNPEEEDPPERGFVFPDRIVRLE